MFYQILCKMSVCDYLMDVFGMIFFNVGCLQFNVTCFWKNVRRMSLLILSLRGVFDFWVLKKVKLAIIWKYTGWAGEIFPGRQVYQFSIFVHITAKSACPHLHLAGAFHIAGQASQKGKHVSKIVFLHWFQKNASLFLISQFLKSIQTLNYSPLSQILIFFLTHIHTILLLSSTRIHLLTHSSHKGSQRFKKNSSFCFKS
jgi:hypothetical protein